MKVIYSFNKQGFEASYWFREIKAASCKAISFIPFNHGSYLDPDHYLRAQQLDNLYFAEHAGLSRMYGDLRKLIQQERPDVLLVDNCHPYHPEFLRTLDVYKAIRTTDGPTSAYDRDFAYLHAYDHVLYHSPAYSRDLTMSDKLDYCGARRHSFWPLAVFDAFCRPEQTEQDVFSGSRDIDIIFVGALYVDKMPFIAAVRKAFGRRFRVYGLASWKKNIYLNVKYRTAMWVNPIRFEDYVPLYRRARIGVNAHLRGKYTVGNYRMFDLPANGVMQLTDGGEYVRNFYEPGREMETYQSSDELIGKLDHFLTHPGECEEIARAGYRGAMARHRIGKRLHELRDILSSALNRGNASG